MVPELPEVEHTRRRLDRWMRGARIDAVATRDVRIVRPLAPRSFVRALVGRTVETVLRRGKWLRLGLDDESKLFVHLGMTGWFERVARPTSEPLRFERVRFELVRRGHGEVVSYVDPRRWGRMVVAAEDLEAWTSLGPDPLTDGIDPVALRKALARRARSSIKEVLMDQRVLAGIGNIQAIEALWHARIDPRRRAGAIDRSELAAIARGLRWTLQRTLADLAKRPASVANPFRVYGRGGEPCPRCGATLVRTVLGGRTTTFCPECQVAKM